MRESSRRIAGRHWAAILECDHGTVFSPGTAVTAWDESDVEILCWPDGAVVAAPAYLVADLRAVVDEIPFDVDRDQAQDLVASVTPVDEVLGPQFVGYCDGSTFEPVESEARQVTPRRLESLRPACPPDEWDRSGLSVEPGADGEGDADEDGDADDDGDAEVDVSTFAVVTDDIPVAAVQYGVVDGVAEMSVVAHPEYRGEGNATAAVSAATAHAHDRDFLAEYRTLERWRSSVSLAERLGFERVARSLLVRPE